MTEFETAQVTIAQIEELEEIIAYSTVLSGSITCDGSGDCTAKVYETPW